MTTFPTLYKKSSTGAIQQWSIAAGEKMDGTGTITVIHGQVDGKLQEGTDHVTEGKNTGKKNATTPAEQARLEAEAKWTKQKQRNGYVESMERAQAGETDAEGGIAPMLAQPEEKAIHKVKYPADAQRKYNGNRCIVVIEDGEVSLWSRKRKRILGMPHIEAAYREAFSETTGRHVFDGELYRHGWSLQTISGYCRKDDTKPGFEEIQHVVYDLPSHPGAWYSRCAQLKILAASEDHVFDSDCVTLTESVVVNSYAEIKALHDKWVLEGFEGAIVRNLDGKYEEGKRSSNLVKVKAFQELEFHIVGVSEGRGKFVGKAVFTCKTEKGLEFDCCAPGTLEERAELFEMGDALIGKQLTVKFFEYSDDGVPVFPVGLVVRDYE